MLLLAEFTLSLNFPLKIVGSEICKTCTYLFLSFHLTNSIKDVFFFNKLQKRDCIFHIAKIIFSNIRKKIFQKIQLTS